jgi:predicted transcriptional regulator
VSDRIDSQTRPVDVLAVFISSSDPAFVTAEIAEELSVTREGARYKMEQLVDEGLLNKKKPGSRTVLYWITDSGRKYFVEHA